MGQHDERIAKLEKAIKEWEVESRGFAGLRRLKAQLRILKTEELKNSMQ